MDDKDYFYFKNFKLRNRDTALKINTDGVLLAVWANTSNAQKVLDVGTGGGVIAFIHAYKNPDSSITGIDICNESIREANYNKGINTEIATKLHFKVESLQEFTAYGGRQYDHIVSNPPFYDAAAHQTLTITPKQKAKHTFDLTFQELLDCSYKLINKKGKLSVIIDYRNEEELRAVIRSKGFYLNRILRVSGKPSHSYNRLLLELGKIDSGSIEEQSLSIRNDDGSYSDEYRLLTKDWYLNF